MTYKAVPQDEDYDGPGQDEQEDGHEEQQHFTPIPKRQLCALALISLAEQTAFNSISPYLPKMVQTFSGTETSQVGLRVGIIASGFSLSQCLTNFMWGWMSDRIGRKPVILFGTICSGILFFTFGFAKSMTAAVLIQVGIGLLNGNQGVVSTVLGEITDSTNQSSAFSFLPMLYSLGSIAGPIIGGLLVEPAQQFPDSLGKIQWFRDYPFLLPNLVSAAVLLLDFCISLFLLQESLEEAKKLPPLSERVRNFFSWLWQFQYSHRPSYTQPLLPKQSPMRYRDVLTKNVVFVLVSYGFFNLCLIAYNSLYPIFISAPYPQGREFSPRDIGISLGYAGFATAILQMCVFTPIQARLGNRWGYRLALVLFSISFFATPFIGLDKERKVALWAELCAVLLLKTLATVIGLTCAMLLITNSTPSPSMLGTLNGLANTLAAAGRALGPFLSGGLFSVATKINRGEFVAWGVFGAMSIIGTLMSIPITEVAETPCSDDEEQDDSA